MVRIGLAGLGKMGVSHLAIAKSHPNAELVAICDSAAYVLDVLHKYTGTKTYSDYSKMIAEEAFDAVIIATPSRFHSEMVRAALDRNLHVFCEKPFCLDVRQGQELADLAASRGLVNQVGYHYRFVGTFREAKRLLDSGAIGRIHHIQAESYGPVVIRPKNATWRSQKDEGGGCLYDYACHAIDLVSFLVGTPGRVGGTVLNKIFSAEVNDEVYTTLYLPNGITGRLACNWSDESFRKMETKVGIWGTGGRLTVDRQEIHLYVRDATNGTSKPGWTVSNTTDLSTSPYYYLRGEEYSAQIAHFIQCIESSTSTESTFASAVATDEVIAMMLLDAVRPEAIPVLPDNIARAPQRSFFSRAKARLTS
jgi:scyllo-inositol 2-dehydrogenase (NADP+)